MTLPSNLTKVNFDAATDDPRQAQQEFADNVDKLNQLLAHMNTSTILSTPLGIGDKLFVDGSNLNVKLATTSLAGVIRTATQTEIESKNSTTSAVTPTGLTFLNASTTNKGLVELATSAEAQAGTSETLAVTPKGLADSLVAGSGITTLDIQTFTADGTWIKPVGAKIVEILVVGGGGGAGGATHASAIAGVNGGTSSFGSYLTATGGIAGNNVATSGDGGIATGGDFNSDGKDGEGKIAGSKGGDAGFASFWASHGLGGVGGTVDVDGTVYGGGGGGYFPNIGDRNMAAGGGGAAASRTMLAGDITSSVSVSVGLGGASGIIFGFTGGDGADGIVVVRTWI